MTEKHPIPVDSEDERATKKPKKAPALSYGPNNPWKNQEQDMQSSNTGAVAKLHQKHKEPVLASTDKTRVYLASLNPLPHATWTALETRVCAEEEIAVNQYGVWAERIAAAPNQALTQDVLSHIFSFLGTPDLLVASEACASWFVGTAMARMDRKRLPGTHPKHLTSQQYEIFRRVVYEKRNVFFTGDAGCGKSYLLQAILAALEDQGRSVQAAAPTGIAAVRLSGVTIHQLVGLNPKKTVPLATYIAMERQRRPICLMAQSLEILVLDEALMATRGLFEAADLILRVYRRRPDEPFGGLQIICTGDPYQLSPVPENLHFFDNSKEPVTGHLFESKSWYDCFGAPVHGNRNMAVLTRPMRQFRDSAFRNLLAGIRTNMPTHLHKMTLQKQLVTARKDRGDTIPDCVGLYGTNQQVGVSNDSALQRLGAKPSYQYRAIDTLVYGDKQVASSLLEQCNMPFIMTLKESCRVLLLRNFTDAQLCNGSQGSVKQMVNLSDHNDAAQLQLMLQHCTCGILGDERYFLEWQERSKTFALCYTDLQRSSVHFGQTKRSHLTCLPMVMFDGFPDRLWLLMPTVYEATLREPIQQGKRIIYQNVVAATREQLPLTLGYAFTIHRAQVKH